MGRTNAIERRIRLKLVEGKPCSGQGAQINAHASLILLNINGLEMSVLNVNASILLLNDSTNFRGVFSDLAWGGGRLQFQKDHHRFQPIIRVMVVENCSKNKQK